MSTIYKWRIYCNTESAFITGFGSTAPTTCYNNAGHSVNSNGINNIASPTTQIITIAQQTQYTVYSPLLDFSFGGSSLLGIPYDIKVVVSGVSTPFEAQIVDITNSNNVIATLSTNTTDTPVGYSFTINTGNINANLAVWELQARSSTGSAPYVSTLEITYY